jgi:2-oxo-3-hexenedioate decarboxylase
MFSPVQLQSIADDIRAAQAQGRQLEPFSARMPGFDLEAGYAVADLLHRDRVQRGERPVGRKLGFTNADMWAIYGVRAPLWAWLYEGSVSQLASPAAVCSLGRFAEPKIEPEIVFKLRSAPPPEAAQDLHALLDHVEWVAHGFEIVQSHFPGWHFQAADATTDQVLHAALLIGPPAPVAQLGPDPVAALEHFSLELFRDGHGVALGRGSHVLGSPLAALAHLLRVLAEQPWAAPLQAGEIVTTGTVTTAQPVRPGEHWHTSLQGLALPGLALNCGA